MCRRAAEKERLTMEDVPDKYNAKKRCGKAVRPKKCVTRQRKNILGS